MTPYSSAFWTVCLAFQTVHFATPAGTRPAIHRGNITILPGGRILSPVGIELPTGPGTFGLAVSPLGKIVTTNLGPERLSLSYMEKEKKGPWSVHNLVTAKTEKSSEFRKSEFRKEESDADSDWTSVFMGVAFSGEKNAWVAEGNSGRVRLVDLTSGARKHLIDLNQDGYSDSFTGDLVVDPDRSLLYVTDQANFRIAVIDTKRNRLITSVKTGRLPFALALSEDRKLLYVTKVGTYNFKLPRTGDSVIHEADSLAIVNVEDPAAPKLETSIRTGLPLTTQNSGGSSPSGVIAGGGQIFISNAHDDSITILDAKTRKIVREVNLRIPGLEAFRGIMPLGMAFDAKSNSLYFAAAGINAVGIIDLTARKVSYVPTGWFPTRVVVQDGNVYVSNAKGHGTGPNVFTRNFFESDGFYDTLRRGSVSVFPVPDAANLKTLTQTVLSANGFIPIANPSTALPKEIKHVVLIVKESRAFDEVFGDVGGVPALARMGATNGYADGGRKRFSLQRINVTPNHHAIAKQWMMSDNFYADSEGSQDGHQWLAGTYPDAWTESSLMSSYAGQKDFRSPTTAPGRLLFPVKTKSIDLEALQKDGTLWRHLETKGISFRVFGGGSDTAAETMNTTDQSRAAQLIQELEASYAKPGKPLPQFIIVHLPNDEMSKPRPDDGYPYQSSYVADNDYALGRIIEYLSHSPWWKEMAVFVTEASAEGGRDHIDSHRTVLLGASPYFKKDYVVHTNSSFPGLLKTVFRLLGVGPLNLYDACAADLSDAFTNQPDFTPYLLQAEDLRLFDPSKARSPQTVKPN